MNDSQDNPMVGEGQPTSTEATPVQGSPTGQGGQSPERIPLDEAIRTASDDLRKAAETVARSLREEAAERLKRLRESSVGDLFDGMLRLVRKNPGTGLAVAVLVGFLIGRIGRK